MNKKGTIEYLTNCSIEKFYIPNIYLNNKNYYHKIKITNKGDKFEKTFTLKSNDKFEA